MSVDHPNKILAHEALPPFPRVFKIVFGLLSLYLVLIFALTGSHYLLGAGH